MNSVSYDVFLDFLNRDSRIINGLFDVSTAVHEGILTRSLAAAALLCRERMLVPPGFLLECDIARRVVERRFQYAELGLLRFPMRDASIYALLEKKRREYGSHSKEYQRLWLPDAEKFLRRCAPWLIDRQATVGAELVARWRAAPDVNDYWLKYRDRYSASDSDLIREIPATLRDAEVAAVWPAITARIPANVSDDPRWFRHLLQYLYFDIYLEEFSARTISHVPGFRYAFGLDTGDHLYSFARLEASLRCIDAGWLFAASAPTIVALRRTAGYWQFRDALAELSRRHNGAAWSSKLALAARIFRSQRRFFDAPIATDRVPANGLDVARDAVEALGEDLAHLGHSLYVATDEERRMSTGRTPADDNIAIFCALEEERRFLLERWNLKSAGKIDSLQYWRGDVKSVPVTLYGPDAMGRVPAAIETMVFLAQVPVKLILVLGIAGGFKDKVNLGDVVVANSVVDMATRKVQEADGKVHPKFRPLHFATNTRTEAVRRLHDFTEAWEQGVRKEAAFPAGKVPVIRAGKPVASLDEVVSSDEWVNRLATASGGEIVALEMESGGVCAAARRSNVEVGVVRGVSDLADPAKSDTEWRRRAMIGVASYIEFSFERWERDAA